LKKNNTFDESSKQVEEKREPTQNNLEEIPTKLVEYLNIYRGSSKEYSLAKKHLNEYITGEI